MDYCELQITSNFSFLRGASHPEEYVWKAAELGIRKIAITDRNSFAGLVRAHAAAEKTSTALIPACRLDPTDGSSLLAYPCNIEAYSELSALLSRGNLRTEKGKCLLYQEDLLQLKSDIQLALVAPVNPGPQAQPDS